MRNGNIFYDNIFKNIDIILIIYYLIIIFNIFLRKLF